MDFYTRKDLVQLLKVSRSTLIRLEKIGLLKPIRLSQRKIIYDRKDVETLIQNLKNKA